MTTQQVGSAEGYTTGITATSPALLIDPLAGRRISWGAIVAGGVVAVVAQIALGLLGASIGSSTINPAAGNVPNAGAFGLASGVWLGLSGLIALFLGGLTVGRLAPLPRGVGAALHGVVMWGVTSLLTVLLLSSAVGSILGGTASVLGSALKVGGQGVAAAAPAASRNVGSVLQRNGITQQSVTSQIESAVGDPQAAQSQKDSLLARIRQDATGNVAPADRIALINQIRAQTHDSHAEAVRAADQYIAQAKAASRQAQAAADRIGRDARQVGSATATGVARGSLVAFLVMVLGALVAALGANLGAVSIVRPKHATPVPHGVEYRSAATR